MSPAAASADFLLARTLAQVSVLALVDEVRRLRGMAAEREVTNGG